MHVVTRSFAVTLHSDTLSLLPAQSAEGTEKWQMRSSQMLRTGLSLLETFANKADFS